AETGGRRRAHRRAGFCLDRRHHEENRFMTAPLLKLADISVSLGGRGVLESVSLEVSAGEFVGLIGPNGAGKSTLLRAAAGLAPLSGGERRIDSAPVSTLTPIDRARRLAYLPQARPVFWSLPARAIVALGRFAYGNALSENDADRQAVDRALEECGGAHLASREAHTLSGGELARIHLARAMAGEAPILLADEPITALDPAHQLSVMGLLRKKADEGRAVVAALHDLNLAARYCTRLAVLHQGRIVTDGAPADALTAEVMRDVFGIDLIDRADMKFPSYAYALSR
ncbi:MAG: ABC transporter ATP-binding protein, partial [Hyphococcus sp.]